MRPINNVVDVTNAIPVADAESFSVPQDGFLLRPTGTLLDGDTDANGDTLYAFKASDPAHGTVAVGPMPYEWLYTPDPDYCNDGALREQLLQAGNEVYDRNRLDRGHLARRSDLLWGPAAEARRANSDSFYFTNISPQMATGMSALRAAWMTCASRRSTAGCSGS